MEGLYLLKELLKEGDFLCKLDLKNAHFLAPLHEESEFCMFRVERQAL